MDPVLSTIATLLFLSVVVIVVLYLSVRIVQQYERLVVFRLGRTWPKMVKDPGLRFLIPFIDRPVKVDVREDFDEIPSQTGITKDNAPIDIDFLIYYKIVDPLASVVNVYNFKGALRGIATTTLRAVIGDMNLDDVLSKREQLNDVLRIKLDEQTERWGGKVTTVEIRELIPPPQVQDSMNRMLTAERTRRAVVTESEGERQSEDQRRRGREAIGHPEGRGQAPVGHPGGRGLQRGPQAHLRGGQGYRRPDDGPAVPRGSQGARRHGGHEVHHPARAVRPGQAPGQLRGRRPGDGPLGAPRRVRVNSGAEARKLKTGCPCRPGGHAAPVKRR